MREKLVNLLTILFDHLPILKINNEIFQCIYFNIYMHTIQHRKFNTHRIALQCIALRERVNGFYDDTRSVHLILSRDVKRTNSKMQIYACINKVRGKNTKSIDCMLA